MDGRSSKVSFVNLYQVYFFRTQSPSGILVLNPSCLVFVLGVTDALDEVYVEFIGHSKQEKNRIDKICCRYDLNWWGDPKHPVLFRFSSINERNVKKIRCEYHELLSRSRIR